MKHFKNKKRAFGAAHFAWLMSATFLVTACGNKENIAAHVTSPSMPVKTVEVTSGPSLDEKAGKEVFRHETFGNEGFWTDAARLPQGLISSKLTPVQALKLGLSINSEALTPELQKAMTKELFKEGLEGKLFNDPAVTTQLLNNNAFIGLVVKDTNNDGKKDIQSGDKMGVSCVLCHGVTDKAVFELPNGGSIGRPVDGPAVHRLNLGAIMAKASNTRAFFPMAQLKDEDGKSIGRAPAERGLDKDSTEAEFDAYFANTQYYPVGSFDDTLDGFGNPMRNGVAFRPDLASPFGSAGEFERFDQYANHLYSTVMDPTNILTREGRQFMERISGSLGVRITSDYAEVLEKTDVKNYPYVKGLEKAVGSSINALVGVRVEDDKLRSLKSYLSSLRSSRGVVFEKASLSRGEEIFKSSKTGCTACHNVDQTQPVSKDIVNMNVIFKGDNPVAVRKRDNLIHPLQDTTESTFDDKMIVINASMRGLNRGVAMPLLLDLGKKPAFLHDGSVPSLYRLLDPARGDSAPHAFYIGNVSDRNDVVFYLKSLDDSGTKK